MSKDKDRIVVWKDKLIEEMTREELVEALNCACKMWEVAIRQGQKDLEVFCG